PGETDGFRKDGNGPDGLYDGHGGSRPERAHGRLDVGSAGLVRRKDAAGAGPARLALNRPRHLAGSDGAGAKVLVLSRDGDGHEAAREGQGGGRLEDEPGQLPRRGGAEDDEAVAHRAVLSV